MPKPPVIHRMYYGCVICRNTEPGHALRWTARPAGGRVAADTLEGVKRLVRDRCKPNSPNKP